MSGMIWLWWLGAVGLSGLGTWLVLRGLFGHRRIASRTRRCPGCRYDMTGRPGEMTCAECGFTAEHEARWYAGRRRRWVAAAGAAAWCGAVVLLVVPECVERRGVAWMLPANVVASNWPAMVRHGDKTVGRVMYAVTDRIGTPDERPGDVETARLSAERGFDVYRSNRSSGVELATAHVLILRFVSTDVLEVHEVMTDEHVRLCFRVGDARSRFAAVRALSTDLERAEGFRQEIVAVERDTGCSIRRQAGELLARMDLHGLGTE